MKTEKLTGKSDSAAKEGARSRALLRAIRGTLIPCLMLTLVLPAALAEWAFIPLETLLKSTDVIVVASLTDVSEKSEKGTDYGAGTLIVAEVLRGNAKAGDKLKLEWLNGTLETCPRIEHTLHTNKTLIWLLQTSTNGTVRADYPGRVLELQRRKELQDLLKK